MIQKILYWEIFLKMFQNDPIRKVITKKVIFEDFLIFSPAVGRPGSTLRKILENFFKKSQVRNSHYLFIFFRKIGRVKTSSGKYWSALNGNCYIENVKHLRI